MNRALITLALRPSLGTRPSIARRRPAVGRTAERSRALRRSRLAVAAPRPQYHSLGGNFSCSRSYRLRSACWPASRSAPPARRLPSPRRRSPDRRPSAVFTPADFARFAPKTAYDMLVQVPGFTPARRRPGARAWPGVGERPDQRPAHRQQVGRRDRRTAEDRGRQCRADRDRRSRQPRHRRPVGPGRQRHRQGSQESERPVRMAARSPRPLCQAQFVSRIGQLHRQDAGRSTTPFRSRTRPVAAPIGGPVGSTMPTASITRTATEIIHNESDLVTFRPSSASTGRASSLGNLTLAYTPYWAPGYQRRSPHARSTATTATASTRDQARRLVLSTSAATMNSPSGPGASS